MHVQLGELAPDFTLRDQNNQEVTLSSFRGSKPVLLVFYPLAFSGICSGELCALRDDLPRVAAEIGTAAQLLTISVDSIFVHRVWAEQEKFEFPLLSDFWPHGKVARDYGVFDDNKGVSRRGTFAIDNAGIMRWQKVNEIPVGRDLSLYTEALSAVA
ncbi:MAG: peroxiredoxin [Acidimicrobiales bacterium]|nr:MAG: peroxiredoxin [Acidimicrobiales bacterium]